MVFHTDQFYFTISFVIGRELYAGESPFCLFTSFTNVINNLIYFLFIDTGARKKIHRRSYAGGF